MTIALIAFFAFWFIGNIVMDEIEREKARFQYVRRKRPARRRGVVA